MAKITADQVLLTGGSGLLGTALRELAPGIIAPSHADFDILDLEQMGAFLSTCDVKTVIHAAAFTSPPKVNTQPIGALNVNTTGTANMVTVCARYSIRLVYISTDYVFKGDKGDYAEADELLPQNLYAWSKLGGECAVRMYAEALIIRTSFCEPVFPYDKAFVDQYTSRDSVEIIAPIILELARRNKLLGVIHVGTQRKTVKQLAHQLGQLEVAELRRAEVNFDVPFDTSFNLTKLKRIISTKEKP